jgi:hypothetical protein
MTEELLMLMLGLAAATSIGFNVLYPVSGRFRNMAAAEAIALSYAIGLGAISLEMLIFHILGLGFGLPAMLFPWLLLAGLNAVIYVRSGAGGLFKPWGRAPSPKPGAFDLFLAGGIAFEVLCAIFRALIKPIESYDAIAIYAIRSKIFYLAGSIPQDYFQAIARAFPHADYPLNIQLFQTYLYIFMKDLNDQLVKAIYPLFFVAILCLLYCALRRVASRTYALVFTFILATIPHFNNYATNAYLEVPLAFYIFASGLFLMRWIDDDRRYGPLVISAFLAGLAGWTKNEGLMYCVIYAAIVLGFVLSKLGRVRMKDIFCVAAYSGIILLVSLPWAAIKSKWNIANDEIALSNINPANLVRQLGKLGTILYELQKQLFGPKKWNIFWPAFILILAFNLKRALEMPSRIALAVIAMALGGYFLFYMISYVDVAFFASKTWARFMLDFLPLAVYLLAVVLKDDVKC